MQIRSYVIKKKIAKGGMGEIYLAMHPTLKKQVVIKKLSGSRIKRNQEQFKKEALIMVDFQCENIVNFYDHFEKSNNYFIVLEYINGLALDEIIAKEPIPLVETMIIFKDILKGIHYAHKKGIIHQDIKPANILISQKGEIKVSDFGISSEKEVNDTKETRSIAGTPAYMAPELFAGKSNASELSDIYALGCLLFAMLAGKAPYPNSLSYKNISNIRKGKIRKIKIKAPFWAKRMLKKMMRTNPNNRYLNVSDILRKIESKLKTKDEIEESHIIKEFMHNKLTNGAGQASQEIDADKTLAVSKKALEKEKTIKQAKYINEKIKIFPKKYIIIISAISLIVILTLITLIFNLHFKKPLNQLPFINKKYAKINLSINLKNLNDSEDFYLNMYYAPEKIFQRKIKNGQEQIIRTYKKFEYQQLDLKKEKNNLYKIISLKKNSKNSKDGIKFQQTIYGKQGRYNFVLFVNDNYYLITKRIYPFKYKNANQISFIHNQRYFKYQSFNLKFHFYNSYNYNKIPDDKASAYIVANNKKYLYEKVKDRIDTGKIYMFNFYADGYKPLYKIPIKKSYFQREGEINIFLDPK